MDASCKLQDNIHKFKLNIYVSRILGTHHIVVSESSIYIFVDREIADFIKMELTKIGRVNLEFKEVSELDIDIKKEFQDFEIVTSSFRIDSIVAKITNKSRSKIKEFLEQEFVKLNHVIVKNGEKNCSVEDILSIRKYGRFTIKSFEQNKRSLNYRITISKLI